MADETGLDDIGAPDADGAATTTIRDSLYDRIALAPREVALIGTPEFLRLDGIKQLGFVSRVWPGAKHTRFEHSLGVLALTRRALRVLRPWLDRTLRPAPADLDATAAAALLHDVGHYPFSHAIEELGPPVLSHEEVGRGIIERGEVAAVLERDWGLDPRRVANLIEPRDPLGPVDAVLVGLLSGTLDMDKLDYLPRDAKACNVPYGRVDTPRLLDALRVARVEGRERIVVGEKGVSPLHSLINARQEMFDNVYWHHTNRACMAMLLRAVQDALVTGAVQPVELTRHDDASLLMLLGWPGMPASTRALVELLRLRRVYKRVVEISARAGELYAGLSALYARPAARRALEIELAGLLTERTGLAVAGHEILIDLPKPEKWKTDVWVAFADPPVGMRPLMHWQEVVGLGDDDFKRYEEHRRLIRIVAAERVRAPARAAWDDLLLPRALEAVRVLPAAAAGA
ncbi:MAG TPA: HD domain-containing protein [Thermomicrobiales bacterium]|nr:HD domain-containing protein [Thermomicrobiales bacterium]